jgi:hypothetical protein
MARVCKDCFLPALLTTKQTAMNKKLFNMKLIYLTIVISIISGGCRKLVETPPLSEQITDVNSFSIDASAIAVLNGIYINMNNNNQPFQGLRGISLLSGLSADELTLTSGITSGYLYNYYQNNLSQTLSGTISGAEHWSSLYNYIFKCNAAIEGLTKSNTLSEGVKKQLLGEATFLRAFYYFYLVNLFGDIPLVLTTDPNVNATLPRSSKASVYQQIVSDLKEAQELLSNNFLDGALVSSSIERVRPTKWAATALLARAYLYTVDWGNAEAQATTVINNTTLFDPITTIPLNSVFVKNGKEAIWQLQPTAINFNTQEARTLVLSSPASGPNGGSNPVYLSSNILGSFESGDLRAKPKNWLDTIRVAGILYYFPYKYKVNASTGVTTASGMTEYFMMLRLGEQYLIRAEARAQQNNISGAQSDLTVIRTRAGLGATTASDKASLLTAIFEERRHELFTEWGHRWLDLKRTGKVDEVMNIVTPQKSNGTVNWQPYQALYPLLLTDIQRNPNLIQNPGY